MNRNIETIVKYRLEQAEEALKDAEILFESGGSLRSVINRSYYAMFYAILALIAAKGRGSSKHYGAISIFDKEETEEIKSGADDFFNRIKAHLNLKV